MFKCTDCQKLYEQKPQYCDCGNNIFEEVVQSVKVTEKKEKKSFSQMYPEFNRITKTLDPISLVIFLICIVLSVLALIFIQPNNETISDKPIKKQVSKNNEIPSIDKLWESTPIVEKSTDLKTQKAKTESKTQTNPIQKIVKNVVVKKEKNVIVDTNKGKSNTEKQTSSSLKEETKTTKTVADLKINETKPSSTQQSLKVNDEKWDNYKVALRQALFNNLEVTSISGSGDCVIEFSIASDGKLIDRNFSRQSQNATVNRAVYNMMMRLPYYYAPPENYNGEKIKLQFSFNNGNYFISYVK